MFDIPQLTYIFFWPFVLLIIFAIGVALFNLLFRQSTEELLPYEKKPFVFDAMSELVLYRTLTELFGDKYYIFPQMSYGRIVRVKKGENSKYRNRFDKKIADFVLCEKDKAVAQLVIELDGSSHQLEKKMERDTRVDKMMAKIGVPILHLKTSSMDRNSIKTEIDRVLSTK